MIHLLAHDLSGPFLDFIAITQHRMSRHELPISYRMLLFANNFTVSRHVASLTRRRPSIRRLEL